MALYKFHPDDIFINTLEAYPEYSFYIHSGTVVIDSKPNRQGSNPDVPNGFESLYAINNDKPAGQVIYPFMTKNGSGVTFKEFTDGEYAVKFNFGGQEISSSYNQSGSIFRDYYAVSSSVAPRRRIESLRNCFNENKISSLYFAYSSSLGDKSTEEASLINIPSPFYGQRMKKGSVRLDYYVSGTLIGTLQDEKYNGELVQTGPEGSVGSGSTAGVVLYKQGIVYLSGSWNLSDNSITYSGSANTNNRWIHFGSGLHKDISSFTHLPSASFNLSYQGVTHTNTMTLLAHAKYGELNYSNNPTYKDASDPNTGLALTSSTSFIEYKTLPKNVTHTDLTDVVPTLEKETYISKVALYDEDKNLIGFAKVATPVRKTEDRQYIIKLKLDI